MLAACTIASNNYLALASVLADSYLEQHPEAQVYICVVDEPSPTIDYDALPFAKVIFAPELDLPAPRNFLFRYDQLELNTAVKPFFLEHLRDREGLDRILYFDPDIQILDRLQELDEFLDTYQCLLTPHITQGLDNVYNPSEIKIRQVGVYNLGFVGLRLDETTAPFLAWWRDRLATYCINSPRDGLFVDQAWMDFAPAFLDDVKILRDPIYNIAYWNLPHRFPTSNEDKTWTIDGRRVGFFHFSGFDLADLTPLSRHQDRLDLDARPELRPLCESYRDRVLARGHAEFKTERYAWRNFQPDGPAIPAAARSYLARIDPHGRRFEDPFDRDDPEGLLAFLTDPIEFEGGPLNRLVLDAWERGTWLHTTMPDVTHHDRERFLAWLNHSGESALGLDPAFWEHLSTHDDPATDRKRRALGAPARWPLRIQPFHLPYLDGAAELLRGIDLSSPGRAHVWLTEAVDQPNDDSEPIITRLALLLHDSREDLRRTFPDPLRENRLSFAYWMCQDGVQEFSLHPDLVAPIFESLPLKTRMRMKLR